jgi:hypothetical protein
MSEDAWLVARLIPTSGIAGADEQERRATSALLAVMCVVREFGRALTQPLGAPPERCRPTSRRRSSSTASSTSRTG